MAWNNEKIDVRWNSRLAKENPGCSIAFFHLNVNLMTSRILFAFSVLVAVFTIQSCKSDSTSSNSNPAGLSATIAGSSWTATTATATKMNGTIMLYGITTSNSEMMQLTVDGSSDTKTGKMAAAGQFVSAAHTQYVLADSINITAHTASHIEGNFAMTARSLMTGDSVKITNGQFNLDIK